MPYRDFVRRTLGIALASGLAVLIALLSGAAPASAAGGFGELARFGKTGVGAGEIAGFEAGEAEALAIGVDPKDNSVYVLDEPKESEEVGKEFIRHIRLQKFKEVGGKYEVTASAEVAEQSPETSKATVEGIAVDSKRERVYFLTTDARAKAAKIDVNRPAASTLYAFSTKESGSTLVPEGKAGAILTGTGAGEFETQSATHGKALLEPAGITVDPKSGDLIILAQEEAEVGGKLKPHYVLQRVSSTGAIGARYVDSTDFLKKGFFEETRPDSPVVVGPESSPHVLVNFEGLVEIPYEFSSSTPPKQIFEEAHNLIKEVAPIEKGVEREDGGTLTASPDGTRVYGDAEIINEHDNTTYPGVFVRSASTGALIGWTGGQSPALSNEDECVLGPLASVTKPLIPLGVGSGEKIFALATSYLIEEEVEEEETPPVPHPAVVELGPGGKGCLAATAGSESVQAKANGTSLHQGEEVPAETNVFFTAHPLGADALSVTWHTENTKTGEKTTVIKPTNPNEGEYRQPKFTFKVSHAGTYVITASIETDDLDTPLLEKTVEEKPISFQLKVKLTAEELKKLEEEKKQQEEKEKAEQHKLEEEHKRAEEEQKKHEQEALQQRREAEQRKLTEEQEANTQRENEANAQAAALKAAAEKLAAEQAANAHTGTGGVLSYQASVASSRIKVSKSGALSLIVDCSGQSSCTGTVTLRTLTAVSSGHSKHKAILTLASASFSAAGGQNHTIAMHLSAAARQLLARTHALKAKATIVARDAAGTPHTTPATVTLLAPPGH